MNKWVLILIILIFILVPVGIAIWYWYEQAGPAPAPQPGGLRQPCNPDATPNCLTGLVCSGGTPTTLGICLANTGGTCRETPDCVPSNTCISGVCVAQTAGGLNQPCRPTSIGGILDATSTPCDTGLVCVNNICKAQNGSPCENNPDCVSLNCNQGICDASPTTALGNACGGDTECPSNLVCSGGYCQYPQYLTGMDGSFCQPLGITGPNCSGNNLCRNNVCIPTNSQFNGACDANHPCVGATVCNAPSGLCLYPSPGGVVNSCSTTNNCDVGSCVTGICRGGAYFPCAGNATCSQTPSTFASCGRSFCFTTKTGDTGFVSCENYRDSVGSIFLNSSLSVPIPKIFAEDTNSFIHRYVFHVSNQVLSLVIGSSVLPQMYITWNLNIPAGNNSPLGASIVNINTFTSSDGNTHQIIDFSGKSMSTLVGLYTTRSNNTILNNRVTSWTYAWQDSLSEFVGTQTLLPPIRVGGVDYNPLEIDVSNNGTIVVSATPPLGNAITLLLLPQATDWIIALPNVQSIQTKPRFFSNIDFAYVSGNSVYLTGSLDGLSYTAPNPIIDYSLTQNLPLVFFIGLIQGPTPTSIPNLYQGLFGYSGAMINPRQGWTTSNGRVAFQNQNPTWSSSTHCEVF